MRKAGGRVFSAEREREAMREGGVQKKEVAGGKY